MHLPNETSVTTLNAVTVNVWLWLEIILNKPRRLGLSAFKGVALKESEVFTDLYKTFCGRLRREGTMSTLESIIQ